MQESDRCALAKWAWRSKEYVVQIRPGDGGLVLQQLLYADEVRRLGDFEIALAEVSDAEVQLALRLIEQISQDSYDPTLFVDEEKQRIQAAVEKKIAGKEVIAPPEAAMPASSNVVDLMEALRASLRTATPPSTRRPAKRASAPTVSVRGARRKCLSQRASTRPRRP
jgi:DNA end-binding protein Ku